MSPQRGIVMHEIGHAIGLVHEHQRPDRDDYVTIIESNIDPGARSQYRRYSWNVIMNMSIPYDYRSIMHYGGKVSLTP